MLDVSEWELGGLEQIGVTQHLWLQHPDDGVLHLWKPAAGRRLQRREHWDEKLASEVAALIGIPCARVELAARQGVAGCLSRNLVHDSEEIFAGALFLSGIDPATRGGHPAYNISNVESVLRDVAAPTTAGLPPAASGFDAFVGYLLVVRADADNPVNRGALQILTPSGERVGWVPDALVTYVSAVLRGVDGEVVVQRLNGSEFPPHPRLLARITGRVRTGTPPLPQLTEPGELTERAGGSSRARSRSRR